MSRAYLCVGKYAGTPYFIRAGKLHIYSIEELCVYLCENAFLLEDDVMSTELVEWLHDECGLEELSKALRQQMQKKGALSGFVVMLLEYAGYYTPEEIKKIGDSITSQSFSSEAEKKKIRADYYMKRAQYRKALVEYAMLCNEASVKNDEAIFHNSDSSAAQSRQMGASEDILTGRVIHNMGVAYARLFEFERAAERFELAYRVGHDEVSYIQYLASMRMLLNDEEAFREFLAGQDNDEAAAYLEQQLEHIRSAWQASGEKQMLQALKEWKNSKQVNDYYEKIEQLINQWKNDYRHLSDIS